MEFEDILVYLKQGHKVARRMWRDKYIHLGVGALGNKTILMETPEGNVGSYLASNADILAIDWFVVTEELKKEASTFLTAKEFAI